MALPSDGPTRWGDLTVSDDERTTDAEQPQGDQPQQAQPEQPAPAGGMAPGWYPAEAGQLRYFDGTVWTGAVSDAPDAAAKASYGEKYRRRLPVVILVIAGIYALLLLTTFAGDPMEFVGRGTLGNEAYRSGVLIGAALGIVLGGFFWTLFVALFPGKHKEKGVRSSLWLLGVAIVIGVVVGVLFGMQLNKTPAAEVPAVTTSAEGCTAFLDTVDELASTRANDAKSVATFAALQEAVKTTNPEMATDLQPLTQTTITADQASNATQSIVLRCLDEGDLTEAEVQAWAEKLQTYAP